MAARKPPPLSAPIEEHKKYAKEVLEDEDYKREPKGGMKPTDRSGKGEKGKPDDEV